MFFRSFKKELTVYALGLVFVTISLTTAISIFSTKTAGDDAAKATSEVLRAQAEELLIQVATSAAQQQDLVFEQIRNDTENLAFYTSNIYENPSVFLTKGYWDFDTRVIRKDGRYINSPSDISTFHIPSFVILDEAERENIELAAVLDFIVPSILDNREDIAAIYSIDNEGVTRYLPNIVLGELGPPDYDPRKDIYYSPAIPANNPERKVIWSPLYDDAAGRGLMITVTAPVYTQDEFMGIVATDVLLENIINTITAYSPIEDSYAFLIDKKGVTIAFPDKAYEDILGRPHAPQEGRINLFDQDLSKEFAASLKTMSDGATGFSVLHNGEKGDLFLAYAPLEQTGFSMGIVAEEEIVLKAVATLHEEISSSIRGTIINLILPTSLFIISAAILIGIFMSNQVVKPIQKLMEGAREIGRGNLDYRIKIKSRNEIGELASSFNRMGSSLKKSRQELYEYSQSLEEQVKERTNELTSANSRLRELDAAKSEFISIASHQLRTPLTAAKGYLSLAIEGTYGKLSEKVRKPIAKVYESNERLIRLVNDLLSLSRIESGKMKLEPVDTNIEGMIASIVDELKVKATQKNLELIFQEPKPALPILRVDSEKVRNAVLNIIDNSIRYTNIGSITVRTAQFENAIRITITDTGEGMTEEELGSLFKSFSRGEAGEKLSTEGAGLGLYIAKQFVQMHKGKIWATSEGKGKGSTFFIELPIEQ